MADAGDAMKGFTLSKSRIPNVTDGVIPRRESATDITIVHQRWLGQCYNKSRAWRIISLIIIQQITSSSSSAVIYFCFGIITEGNADKMFDGDDGYVKGTLYLFIQMNPPPPLPYIWNMFFKYRGNQIDEITEGIMRPFLFVIVAYLSWVMMEMKVKCSLWD